MNSRENLPFKKSIRWGGQELDSRFNELDFLATPDNQKDEEKIELQVNPKKIEDPNEPLLT